MAPVGIHRGGDAGCTAGAIGCNGAASVPLDVEAGTGAGMRSPLSWRLTLGKATCSGGRTSGELLLPNQTFTSSECGSKLMVCALPPVSETVVPIGREKLNVAAWMVPNGDAIR